MNCDRLWQNARLATLTPSRAGLGEIEDGVIACRDGVIQFAGARSDAPARLDAADVVDCGGRWITPGLIECHTHLVHAGNRAHEFEMRLNGVSYETIARQGGGIVATMNATRAVSAEELVAQSAPRLQALMNEGVTTVEIKSGYGLSLEHERKQLRAARNLAERRKISITTTFLGAHAVPPEFVGRADAYIEEVCSAMIPTLVAEGLVDAVDVFCEGIGFSPQQAARVFAAAAACGLRVKVHAEQLSNLGGAALAAASGALSADHLEYLDADGVAALARSGTTAVLLPGAYYFVRETKLPPMDLLRGHGVRMALATDCNPGTTPLTSLLLAMNMGAVLFRMTVEECLVGVTRSAAHALGQAERIGTPESGKFCDLAIWDIERPADLVHRMGYNPLHTRVWRGH